MFGRFLTSANSGNVCSDSLKFCNCTNVASWVEIFADFARRNRKNLVSKGAGTYVAATTLRYAPFARYSGCFAHLTCIVTIFFAPYFGTITIPRFNTWAKKQPNLKTEYIDKQSREKTKHNIHCVCRPRVRGWPSGLSCSCLDSHPWRHVMFAFFSVTLSLLPVSWLMAGHTLLALCQSTGVIDCGG